MRRKIIALCLILGCMLSLCACGAEKETIEFIMADVQTGDHPTALSCDKFAELVEEKSDGRIIINVYHGDVLGIEQEQVRQVTVGGIDFVRATVSVISAYNDRLQALQALYLFRDDDHMWNVLNGELGQEMLTDETLLQNNIIGLTWFSGGTRNFYTVGKPITVPSDISGMNIRVNTPSMTSFIEKSGGIAKNIAYTDILASLQSGVIDGAENNWPSYVSTEHYTVANYITIDEHTRVPEMIIASKSAMDALSAEDQALIKECAAEAQAYQIEKMREDEEKAIKVAEEAGCTITRLNEEQAKAFQEAGNEINKESSAAYMSIIEQIKATE